MCWRNKNSFHTCLVRLCWTIPLSHVFPLCPAMIDLYPKSDWLDCEQGKLLLLLQGSSWCLTSWSDWLTPGQARALPQEEKREGEGGHNHTSYSRPLEHRSIPIRALMMTCSHLAKLPQPLRWDQLSEAQYLLKPELPTTLHRWPECFHHALLESYRIDCVRCLQKSLQMIPD